PSHLITVPWVYSSLIASFASINWQEGTSKKSLSVCLWLQHYFDRVFSVPYQIKPFLEFLQRQGLSHNFRDIDLTRLNEFDRQREGIRAQVSAMDVNLFAVANDAPVNCRWLAKHTKLDHEPQFTDHLQPLNDTVRMTGCFNIFITTVTIGFSEHRFVW